jgi:hypothetical protein
VIRVILTQIHGILPEFGFKFYTGQQCRDCQKSTVCPETGPEKKQNSAKPDTDAFTRKVM